MNRLLATRDDNDMGNFLVERSTTSGMVKCICEQKKVFVASPEIYDFLNTLLKNDEVKLLCELFSGKRTSYRYATECISAIVCEDLMPTGSRTWTFRPVLSISQLPTSLSTRVARC